MGVLNAHLRTEANRSLFSGTVQEIKLDVVVVVETWFEVDTSNKLMGKCLGDSFAWMGKERVQQSSLRGEGGIGIIVRKERGDVSLIKYYELFEGMWVKLVCGKDTFFICAVYAPPRDDVDFDQILRSLEEDIWKFKQMGKVVVMGDFNARINSNPSIVQGISGECVFDRKVVDQGVGVARSRGISLVDSMNSVNMIIINGIDSGGGYTFENKNGSSTIDLIIVSDNIFMPGNTLQIDANNTKSADIKSSDVVSFSDSIPIDSLYCPKSCQIWTDYKYRIGDHFLITCKIEADKPTLKIPFQEVGHKLNTIRWARRDKGDPNFWIPMQHALINSFQNWNPNSDSGDVDSLVSDFNTHVNDALYHSLKISKRRTNQKQQYIWNQDIFELTIEENKAFYQYKNANLPEKSDLMAIWKKCKLKLKNTVRNFERDRLKERVRKLESLRSRDPKEFWNGLMDLDNTTPISSSIPLFVKNSAGVLVGGNEASQVWMDSFAKLGLEKSDFGDYDLDFYHGIKQKVAQYQVDSFKNNFVLDYPIKVEEVKKAVQKLKKGKAVGIDGFFNEIWKFGGDHVVDYLCKFYRLIFLHEQFPVEWARGLIFPLFKGGPEDFKLDPNKYRGITLLSIVGKTYTSILNARVSDYCENNGILVDEQAGFRRNRSTVDQIYILTEVIKHRRPNPTYCAFIDVAKAYDKVWREGLWYKLWKAGIRGKMWRVLRNMYRKVESSVLLGDTRTDFFEIDIGLRQGCILSPLLFILFINDLRDLLDKLGKGVKWGKRRISLLYFADDIVLLSDTKEGLEEMLKLIYEYSLKWRMKFNFDKSQVVIFQNIIQEPLQYGQCVGKCLCGHHFFFGPQLIKEVLYYKYLGIELDHRLTFKMFKQRVLARARASMNRIWGLGIRSGYLSVQCALNLWQGLVRSIMEYGSQVWGNDQWPQGEKVQREMAIRILRCSSFTTYEVIQGELGMWTLQARRDFNHIMFYFHLVSLEDTDLRKQVYFVTKQTGKNTCWAKQIKDILAKYALVEVYDNEKKFWNLDGHGNGESKTASQHKKFVERWVRGKVQLQQKQAWLAEMLRGDISKKKIRTYVTFKQDFRLEKYLLVDSDVRGRSYHTSLRSGTNCLEIERGRHMGIDKKFRFCKNCDTKSVEDERHFLMLCPLYKDLRAKFFKTIVVISEGKWNFQNKPVAESFVLLMQGTGDEYERIIFQFFHTYLTRCFALRNRK